MLSEGSSTLRLPITSSALSGMAGVAVEVDQDRADAGGVAAGVVGLLQLVDRQAGRPAGPGEVGLVHAAWPGG